MSLLYVVLLLVLFYLLLVAEFLLPTSGFLAIAAVAALVAAVVIAFGQSTSAGLTTLGAVTITTPLVLMSLVKWWPHTPIGRRMLNRRPGEIFPESGRKTPRGIPLVELVGQQATAKTDLLPAGLIQIGGERVDAVSIGMPIDAGTLVVVTSVQAGKVRVRPASEADLHAGQQPAKPQSPPSLESSLESFDFE